MKTKRTPSNTAFSERPYVMNCISTSLCFYQKYNMTHVWNSSACLLILSWRMGIREASPASQKNRECLSDILLTPSWKTGPALSTSFLRGVLLACTVHFTKRLWRCLNPSRSALLVCHHPYAICKFGSESKLKVSLLQFKPTISCTSMVHVLSQKHFHIEKSISVPFKNSYKNGLRLLVIKSSF